MICSLINNIDELNILKDYIDGVCINTNYSISLSKISNNDVKNIVIEALKVNKKVILKIDMLPSNKDVKEIINFLDNLNVTEISLLIGDLGLFYLLKDKYEVIYANSVLVTSTNAFNFYKEQGFNLIMPSLEITFDDTLKFDKEHIFFKSFGYHQMMHSKRKLISTYYDFINQKDKIKESYNGHLIEEIRNEKYKIYENEDGTVILRQHPVNYYEEVNNLKEFKYIYLDSQFIEFNLYKEVVKTYFNLLNDKLNISEAAKIFENINVVYENNFLKNSTIYQKGSLK